MAVLIFTGVSRDELKQRNSNLKKLREKWAFKQSTADERMKRDAEEWGQVATLLGWDEDVDEDILDALIRRAIRLKEATENQQTVDWSMIKSTPTTNWKLKLVKGMH